MDYASRATKNSLAGCFCPAGRKAPGRSCSHPPAYVSLTFVQKKTASVSLHQRFFHGAKQPKSEPLPSGASLAAISSKVMVFVPSLSPLIRSIQKERQAGYSRMPVFARDGSTFQKIMHRIKIVANTDMSVIVLGENGTGKEHIAHQLHNKSKRAGKPFVAVDCGSLTKELAPSAFFGHVKGAFTGADCTKKGYFHEAEGGTLFLDEVGNLAMETQQMLLRAIQERRYRPIGDTADYNFNIRIIAATNEDMEAAVSEKRFRQDLLYRLHDFEIIVPPLSYR